MPKPLLLSSTAALVLVLAAPAYAECETCKLAQTRDGWCADCKVGYFDGVAIRSKKLYAALAGKPVDPAKLRCAGCLRAAKQNGWCADCKRGFASRKAYGSKVAQQLARGVARDVSRIECSVCRRAARNHGWCDTCQVGLVGPRAFKDRQAYSDAVAARKILLAAAKAAEKCPQCAVALITDGTCPACKVSYKNGTKLTRAPAAPGK